jgi:anti-sigma factor RsiW
MQTDETVQEDLKQWLLGLLPQQESHSMEERLITDAALYEELFIVEDELIDDYLAGRLSANEREAFESYFMNSPERQEQFRIANALRVYIDDSKQDVSNPQLAKPPPHESSLAPATPADRRWGFFRKPIAAVSLAAAALLVVTFAWLALSLRSPSSGNSLSVFLTPGVQTREGGSVQTVTLPPGTESLQLHLRLTRNDFQKYRATLVNSEGNVVQTSENLSPLSDAGGPTIQFSVRAGQLPPGEYRLKLDGVAGGTFESADSYRFVVITQ